MAPPVSEIVYITLKPSIDLEGQTAEAKAWQEGLAIIASQDGYQRAWYGRQLEDPSVLVFVIDWDSKASHLKFIADPSYGPFKEKLGVLMAGVHYHHIVQPDTTLLTRAPLVVLITFYDVETGILENMDKFVVGRDKDPPKGYYGAVYAEVLEKIVRHADVGVEGAKEGNAIMALAGWESKQAHVESRDTEFFRNNASLLREKNGGAEACHVAFKAV